MPHVGAVLTRLRDRHPQLEVEVRTLGFVRRFGALAGGEVDAAFPRGPLPSGFQSRQLATEPRVMCPAPGGTISPSYPGPTEARCASGPWCGTPRPWSWRSREAGQHLPSGFGTPPLPAPRTRPRGRPRARRVGLLPRLAPRQPCLARRARDRPEAGGPEGVRHSQPLRRKARYSSPAPSAIAAMAQG
ncbi:substrate-binding domain-containing protein [Streptomyces sp. LP11]|uniref:Substrate-binding domain-containing protein n=1 Tax=Streptomyces pyxinicus TaxID=2970331 RepID=A0ABT2B4P1_9ACTN|nr:substrate-binding domain-containing protein [Streptomyces sp. LP11]MCS0603472.1 substrate-binding domain-containing protein [Streptomyces sp. LP11]